jgi:hypothetical protein
MIGEVYRNGMTFLMTKDVLWYMQELKSNGCACDHTKTPGRSFCFYCYSALPNELQRALYKPMGREYAEAYEEACKYLEENVWNKE